MLDCEEAMHFLFEGGLVASRRLALTCGDASRPCLLQILPDSNGSLLYRSQVLCFLSFPLMFSASSCCFHFRFMTYLYGERLFLFHCLFEKFSAVNCFIFICMQLMFILYYAEM